MKKIPFGFTLIKGAIGKQFVVKHYRKGPVITKYPDMTNIVASIKQETCRQLFKEASAYAVRIIGDQGKKEAFKLRTGKNTGLYNAAIKEYMLCARTITKDKTLSRRRMRVKIKKPIRRTLPLRKYSPLTYTIKSAPICRKEIAHQLIGNNSIYRKILYRDNYAYN